MVGPALFYRQPPQLPVNAAVLSSVPPLSVSLKIETVNTTSKASLRRRLEKGGSAAHILCAQEIGIVHHEALDFQYWARSRGWLSIIEPSVARAVGATSAGAGIFVRDFLGLLPPESGKT